MIKEKTNVLYNTYYTFNYYIYESRMAMIKGIGIDIVELARIERLMLKKERFIRRILSDQERLQYEQLRNERRRLEYVAGRFAAKEAFAKATQTGIGELRFTHIEVLATSSGAPVLNVAGYDANKVFVSISHSEHYAVAQVIIVT